MTPSSLFAGDLSDYSFSLNLPKDIGDGNYIKVDFPIEFHIQLSVTMTGDSCLVKTAEGPQYVTNNATTLCSSGLLLFQLHKVYNPVYISIYINNKY